MTAPTPEYEAHYRRIAKAMLVLVDVFPTDQAIIDAIALLHKHPPMYWPGTK